MNQSHATRGLVRFVAMVIAMVGVGLTTLTLTKVASAAPGDVGARAFRYGPGMTGSFIDPDVSPTATKPQSKLWYAQGRWWGVLLNDGADAFRIYSFDAGSGLWSDTGVEVDPRERSHLDVLWDGTHLYTVGAVQRTASTTNDAIRFNRFSYDAVNRTYTKDTGYAATLNGGAVEAPVIAQDSTHRLWVAYTVPGDGGHNVRVVVSPDRGNTWGSPTAVPVPGSTGLTSDDIASVVSHSNKISVVWSKQVPRTLVTPAVPDDPATPADESQPAVYQYDSSYLYAASHADSEPLSGGWTSEALLTGVNAGDDHINMSVDGDGSGRVFVVAKAAGDDTHPSDPGETLIRLFVLQGDVWTSYRHSTVADDETRPVVVVDRDAGLIRVFATAPVAGGVIYEKHVSLASPTDFPEGRGTPVLDLESDPFINNVTTTKQNVTVGTGLLLLASDQQTGHYVHNADSVPKPPAAPTVRMTSPTSRFTTSRTVSAAWGAVGEGPPVTYEVSRKVAGYSGAFSAASTWLTTAQTSGRFTGQVGRTYCMQARGKYEVGTVGSYSPSRCTAVPLDDRNLSRSRYWSALSPANAYLGTAMRTSRKGAAMAKTVTGKNVSLIVTRSRGAGLVNVYRGTRLIKRINLAATTTRPKQFVPIASYRTAATSTFRFVVVSKGKPVTIDGLAVSRN